MYYWVFSKSGYTDNVKEMAENEHIQLLELDTLVFHEKEV